MSDILYKKIGRKYVQQSRVFDFEPDMRGIHWTKKQAAVLIEFRKKMREVGGTLPTWWSSESSHEIADAAINAVKDFKP